MAGPKARALFEKFVGDFAMATSQKALERARLK
jgi:hypothetical protein